ETSPQEPPLAAMLGMPSRAAEPVSQPTPRWDEVEEERAAIVEYDRGIPRTWAEGCARLDPDRPPGDVPLRRWQRFVDDVGLFLDSAFCAVAAAFGWGRMPSSAAIVTVRSRASIKPGCCGS